MCLLHRVLLHHSGGLSQDQNVRQVCEELYSSGNRSPFLLAFLVDMCEENIDRGDKDKADSLHRAVQVISCSMKYFSL
jgi:protein farnesyltransferase/geranylgeranyltransferase type-1 subunit alpha